MRSVVRDSTTRTQSTSSLQSQLRVPPDGPEVSVNSEYDRIGVRYARTRKADARLATLILSQLEGTRTVVNVGAGAGSYEPTDRFAVAVEPSAVMIGQRRPGSAPVVQALAESLPFPDSSFEAGLAVLTVHHWHDPDSGLAELSRVVRKRIVMLTWDPSSDGFWLMQDYFPEFLEVDRKRIPSLDRLQQFLSQSQITTVPIPHDCADGFLGAYWRRPEAYLDPDVRNGISSFAKCQDLTALRRLEQQLDSGEWARRYGDLLALDELDLGYRLIVGRPATG